MAKNYTPVPYNLSYTKQKLWTKSGAQSSYSAGSVDYTVFPQEFFAGANLNIYFGDILIDEVVGMALTLEEQALPIYGYGSYTWDAIAKGNRAIRGTFSIYYKEEGYLNTLLTQINNGLTTTKTSKPAVLKVAPEDMTLESLLTAANSKDPTAYQKLADAYEDALWGDNESPEASNIKSRDKDSYFTPHTKETIRTDGFKIVIVFGPEARKTKAALPANMSEVPTTVKTIHGVHLLSSKMVINNDGQPIFEEYEFLARDMDELN